MIFRILLCLIMLVSSLQVATAAEDRKSNDIKRLRKSSKLIDHPYILKTLHAFSPFSGPSSFNLSNASVFKKYKIFFPTVKNTKKLIKRFWENPDLLILVAREVLGRNISGNESSSLEDNLYYRTHRVLTGILYSTITKDPEFFTYRKDYRKDRRKLNLFDRPDYIFYKVIFLNTIYALYVANKEGSNYNSSISDFYDEFKELIIDLFGANITEAKFEDYLYVGNLMFPFALTTVDADDINYKKILSVQKHLPMSLTTYIKLRSFINFDIQNLFDFSPIFAASSLISIYTSDFITPSDKKHIEEVANNLIQSMNEPGRQSDAQNIYMQMALAEISGEYIEFFRSRVFDQISSDTYEDTKVISGGYETDSKYQIRFSTGGFLLRSVAINAKHMFSYIMSLYYDELVSIDPSTLFNATINAVIYDRKTMLKELMNISDISNNELFLQYIFDLAISKKKFIIAGMIQKAFPEYIESNPQSFVDTNSNPTLSAATKQDLRFNIYRQLSKKSCDQLFSEK